MEVIVYVTPTPTLQHAYLYLCTLSHQTLALSLLQLKLEGPAFRA